MGPCIPSMEHYKKIKLKPRLNTGVIGPPRYATCYRTYNRLNNIIFLFDIFVSCALVWVWAGEDRELVSEAAGGGQPIYVPYNIMRMEIEEWVWVWAGIWVCVCTVRVKPLFTLNQNTIALNRSNLIIFVYVYVSLENSFVTNLDLFSVLIAQTIDSYKIIYNSFQKSRFF